MRFVMKVRYVFLLFSVTSLLCRWIMGDNPVPGLMEVPNGLRGFEASLKRLLVDSGVRHHAPSRGLAQSQSERYLP
jgi:hypothetical protein